MTLPEPPRRTAWHESAAIAFVWLIGAVIVTSPCWGYALILAVSK